jgi:hypothetical protein
MTIGARITYFANALQQCLSTARVWLGDAIAFLSRTVWPLVDLLIRVWIGKLALVFRPINSEMRAGNRDASPSADRYSRMRLRPSV